MPENSIERINRLMAEARQGFVRFAQAFMDDGPGPRFQLWKFGHAVKQIQAETPTDGGEA